MNGTNQKQSFVKSEMRYYFIRLTTTKYNYIADVFKLYFTFLSFSFFPTPWIAVTDDSSKQQQEQERQQLFQKLDYEYEVARVKTHTQRGFGLGFGSMGAPHPGPSQSQPPGPEQKWGCLSPTCISCGDLDIE